jgi:hypothetical protein
VGDEDKGIVLRRQKLPQNLNYTIYLTSRSLILCLITKIARGSLLVKVPRHSSGGLAATLYTDGEILLYILWTTDIYAMAVRTVLTTNDVPTYDVFTICAD